MQNEERSGYAYGFYINMHYRNTQVSTPWGLCTVIEYDRESDLIVMAEGNEQFTVEPAQAFEMITGRKTLL